MTKPKIKFEQIPIPVEYGPQFHKIYHVIRNDRLIVLEKFRDLDDSTKAKIKNLISNMATIKHYYRSPDIIYSIHGYKYGELRPLPHRFFFFRKCGNNYIFFAYTEKKKNSLPNRFYQDLDRKRLEYEEEFKKFIERSK